MKSRIAQREVNYRVFQVGLNWPSSTVSFGDQKSLRRRIVLFALLRTWWALRSMCLASLNAFCACRIKTFNSSRVAASFWPLLSNFSIRFTSSPAHSITCSASRWYSITRYCNSSICVFGSDFCCTNRHEMQWFPFRIETMFVRKKWMEHLLLHWTSVSFIWSRSQLSRVLYACLACHFHFNGIKSKRNHFYFLQYDNCSRDYRWKC